MFLLTILMQLIFSKKISLVTSSLQKVYFVSTTYFPSSSSVHISKTKQKQSWRQKTQTQENLLQRKREFRNNLQTHQAGQISFFSLCFCPRHTTSTCQLFAYMYIQPQKRNISPTLLIQYPIYTWQTAEK